MEKEKLPVASTWSKPSPSPSSNKEAPRVPSPCQSVCTTVTPLANATRRQPSPAPSTSSSLTRGQISIRPLSSLMEPDPDNPRISSSRIDSQHSSEPSGGTMNDYDPSKDWRCLKRSIKDRLRYILQHESDTTFHDVVFHVRNERIKAHQLLLRIASPVFDRMLREAATLSELACSSSHQTERVIIIQDMEPSIFRYLLNYIYTDEVSKSDLPPNRILKLLKAAKLYRMVRLYDKCKIILTSRLNEDIALELYETASNFDDKELRHLSGNVIADHAFNIFESEEFVNVSEQNFRDLLDRNDLNIDELSVFVNVVRWAKSKCKERGIPDTSENLRKILGDIIYKIRFPLITGNEIALKVSALNILSPEEQILVMKYVCVDRENWNELPPIPFKTEPRLPRKVMELSSDTDDAEKTPVRGRRCSSVSTSVVTAESVDIASEHGSEINTSGTSEHSDVHRKKSSKSMTLKRSHSSTANDPSPKETNKRRRSNSTQFKSLFGEGDYPTPISTEIARINLESFSLNSFIVEMNARSDLKNVESIVFDNVTVTDFANLSGQKVYFPNLKTFKMNIKTEDKDKARLKNWNWALEKLLFFSIGKDTKHWAYEDLYHKTKLDILRIIVNKVVVLTFYRMNAHLILNKFDGAPIILKSVRKEEIKSLIYSHTELVEKNFPLTLNRLVILGTVMTSCASITQFLQSFGQLKELTLLPPATPRNKTVQPVVIDKMFKSRKSLKLLALRDFELSIEKSTKLKSMNGLYLWGTTWSKEFEDRFHEVFGNLKELLLAQKQTMSVKLLKNILKVSSLKEVFCWSVDWGLTQSDIDYIRKRYKVTLNLNEKSFCLKKTEDGNWSNVKVSGFTDFMDYMYSKFQYEFIYEDLETYRANRTSS